MIKELFFEDHRPKRCNDMAGLTDKELVEYAAGGDFPEEQERGGEREASECGIPPVLTVKRLLKLLDFPKEPIPAGFVESRRRCGLAHTHD
jgi:hypothetical protein